MSSADSTCLAGCPVITSYSIHYTKLYDAETILLLGALRQYFSCIIVNGCGQADSDFIRALVRNNFV